MASLLVQQLLTHFSQVFLGYAPSTPDPSSLEQMPLKDFLCQDATMLLLVAIQIVSQQVRGQTCVPLWRRITLGGYVVW